MSSLAIALPSQISSSSAANTSTIPKRKNSFTAMMKIPAHTHFTIDNVPEATQDSLFALINAYKADTFENKVDLGVGAYRDDNAKPWILPVIKKATNILHDDQALNHEYLPIDGLQSFKSAAARLIFGSDSSAIRENRVASLQSISGTGSLHLGALFISRFHPEHPTVYISNPTWVNHQQVFSNVSLSIAKYPYFCEETRSLDIEGMKARIGSAPDHSIILLHACAHNPTGVDPTIDQWKELATIMKQKSHLPFFDCAYQGFASGNLDKDAWAIRHFVEQGFEVCVAQSFAKNLGLYNERVGCFHFVTKAGTGAEQITQRIASQLMILQRSEISNPPAYGARLASLVLNDPQLFDEWKENLYEMSSRIILMRKRLRNKLEELQTPGTWEHITDQIGMFSFTGLRERHALRLRETAHIYMTNNGRISMAGLNNGNVEYVARSIDRVVREAAKIYL